MDDWKAKIACCEVTMKGEDALDLLHRLSTNKLDDLALNETRDTLLTTNQGKLVDWIRVTRVEECSLRLIGSAGRAQIVSDWLENFTVMEDSATHVVEESRIVWRCSGVHASKSAESAGLEFINGPPGFSATIDVLQRDLPEHFNVLATLTEAEYEAVRIAAGVPSPDREFAAQVNPLELHLGAFAVSFAKGCYVGQEVLSRMDSYDKVSRHLKGWRSSVEVQIDDTSRIVAEGKSLGRITSISPEGRRGLANLKRGSPVHAFLQTGDSRWEVELLDLPFWNGS